MRSQQIKTLEHKNLGFEVPVDIKSSNLKTNKKPKPESCFDFIISYVNVLGFAAIRVNFLPSRWNSAVFWL